MPFTTPRLKREAATVQAMIRLYCRLEDHPREGVICTDCAELMAYAIFRLEKCPFQEGKTTCAKCPVHCYRSEMRARIRKVMRVAGPRMFLHHPILTIRHFIDGGRKTPVRPAQAKDSSGLSGPREAPPHGK